MLPMKRKNSFLLLALLLVFLFVLLSYQLKFPQSAAPVRKVVLEVTSVMESSVDQTLDTIKGVWRRYLFLHGLVEENKQLREANVRLVNKVMEYREAHLENIRLRQLLDFK